MRQSTDLETVLMRQITDLETVLMRQSTYLETRRILYNYINELIWKLILMRQSTDLETMRIHKSICKLCACFNRLLSAIVSS